MVYTGYAKLSLQDKPRPCSDNWPVLAVVWDLGMVEPSVSITKHLNVLYDQVYSIRYVVSTWPHARLTAILFYHWRGGREEPLETESEPESETVTSLLWSK